MAIRTEELGKPAGGKKALAGFLQQDFCLTPARLFR